MRRKITLGNLRRRGACAEGIEWAENVLRQDPGADLLLAAIEQGLLGHVRWAIRKGVLATDETTRAAVCTHPEIAFYYAFRLDKQPHHDTRAAACQDPFHAYSYAIHVDKASRKDTRKAACSDPRAALLYALYVDRGARRNTRIAACGDPFTALEYAREVDNTSRPDTKIAASRNPIANREYTLWEESLLTGDQQLEKPT